LKQIGLTINSEAHSVLVAPNATLLYILRDQLGLIGTREGCDSGVCGSCTVLVDGEPALSCMMLAIRCHNKHITTIEGLAEDGKLHPLQESAIEQDAVQCGYCTGGWLMSAKALLDRTRTPTRDQIRAAIAGHLCRCAAYRNIEEAIASASAKASVHS
jgi:aerobic-type carbon monoxide dehydrogenase small subunit (CoxS/CutS family)